MHIFRQTFNKKKDKIKLKKKNIFYLINKKLMNKKF